MREGTESRLQDLAKRMRADGFRTTPQRVAIPRVLLDGHHPTAEDIHQQVAAQFPMMSLATVYKTLNLLEALGEVIELRMKGCKHYDGDTTPHPHLTCVKCHCIVDLPSAAMPKLPEQMLADTGFRILGYNLKVLGLCPKCQKQKQQEANTINHRKENLQ